MINWKNIILNEFENRFYYNNQLVFEECQFEAALKFHAPGLAPVKVDNKWFHINTDGKAIYEKRYKKAFGYYFNRAVVVEKDNWFHIDVFGKRINEQVYNWCGNFQENVCTVRDKNDNYFHLDLDGNRCYEENYSYAGDFKYGFACVMNKYQQFTHIDKKGQFLHQKWFLDLGVYHKGFATARDDNGWFHIDFDGNEIYPYRFAQIEPFYNGWAFATNLLGDKVIISENGNIKKLNK